MLKSILQRAAFGAVGTLAMALAAALAVVSAGYALYAALRTGFGPASAAGLTALAAAILCGVLATIGVQLTKGRSSPPPPRDRGGETVRSALTTGAALAAAAADVALQYRAERRTSRERSKRKRRS